jgi:hypothetical protein
VKAGTPPGIVQTVSWCVSKSVLSGSHGLPQSSINQSSIGRDGPPGRPSKGRLCEWLNPLGGAFPLSGTYASPSRRFYEPEVLPFVNQRSWTCERTSWEIP